MSVDRCCQLLNSFLLRRSGAIDVSYRHKASYFLHLGILRLRGSGSVLRGIGILEMNFDPLSRATLQPTKELIANSPIVQFYTTPTRPQHLWSLPPSHLFSFWRSRVTKFSTSSFIAKKRHVTLVIGSVNPITSQPWHSLFKHWNTKRRN